MILLSPVHPAPAIIEVVLVRSTAAYVEGRPFDFTPRQARSGVVPRVARHLLAEGHDPKTILRITRNGTVVFKDATLEAWSKLCVEEGDRQSVRFRAYREWNADDLVRGGDRGRKEELEGPA